MTLIELFLPKHQMWFLSVLQNWRVLSETGSTLTCQEMYYLAIGIQWSSPPSQSQLHVIILHSSCLSSSLFQAVFNQFPLQKQLPTFVQQYRPSVFLCPFCHRNQSIHRCTVNLFWQYLVIFSLFILFRV